MPNVQDELLARFGREPLNIALEHVGRWPKRAGAAKDESELRARAFVLSALGKKAHAAEGEFVWNHLTCGYFKRADGLAIVPVWGDVGPMRAFWPWVWYEDLADAAEDAAKDDDVKAILFHFDSPGGYVTGLAECGASIESVAQKKPCAAFANDYATSAAYWLACATGRVTAPPTGVVNSIGSICLHEEYSRMLDDAGVTVNVIRSAPRKAEANPFEPLSQAARQQLQTEIAACADEFVAAIARMRGLSDVTIRGTQAACATADQAAASKFIDGVETFDQACAALLERAANPTGAVSPTSPVPAAARASRKPVGAAAPSSKNPARGKSAQTTPTQPRASARRSTTMTKKSQTDPSTLTPEEQIARYDQIDAIMAEEPADDNAKIGQYVQIAGIVNAPAGEAAPSEEPATEGEEAAPAATVASERARAKAISESTEGKANPAAANAAIAQGLSLAAFKAMAPHFGKGATGFGSRMAAQPSAQRLEADAPDPTKKGAGGGNVVNLDPGKIYEQRAQQARGSGATARPAG